VKREDVKGGPATSTCTKSDISHSRNDVQGFLRRAPAGEGAEAHDFQPGEGAAWAKARRPAVPQPGVVAISFSRPPPQWGGLDLDSRSSGCARLGGGVGPPLGVRVGVSEGLVACSSESLSTSVGLGRYWAAPWHLARAVRKRFRGAALSASMFIVEGTHRGTRHLQVAEPRRRGASVVDRPLGGSHLGWV